MGLDRIIVKETPYPESMTPELAEQWAEIPLYPENDPNKPEWTATPTIPVDLSSYGYGLVYVKNEAVLTNPTASIKDRPAWEAATWYRDFARRLILTKTNPHGIKIPRLSIITAGNMGKSLATRFEMHNLPPIKMLIDRTTPQTRIECLKRLHSDIYMTDFSAKKLSAEDIKNLTNNKDGADITSLVIFEPHAIFYDWHVHETFNEQPDEIYLPCGSAKLFENYLYRQLKTAQNAAQNTPDPRLKAPAEKVIKIDIFASEPEKIRTSCAKALVKTYNPFKVFYDKDITDMQGFECTGRNTGVYRTQERYITIAPIILGNFMPTGPSAAAGLALYIQRFEQGLIDLRKKVLIVNTGRDI